MENGEGCNERRHLEVGFAASESKKQWKNPSQVQILENAYAVSRNPSAAVKEELAKLTGLDYKQVQYWFGNRRYIDRHGPRRYRSANDNDGRYVKLEAVSSTSMSSSSTLIGPAMLQTDVATEMTPELQRVVKHIEKELGYPMRQDGPILGVEFKPLPPGAFGAPLVNPSQKRETMSACNGNVAERPNVVLVKAETSLPILEKCSVAKLSNNGTLVTQDIDQLHPNGSPKALQEYQFFPMQPSWLESYGRVKQSGDPFSSVDSPNCEMHPSVCTKGDDKQQHDYKEVQRMVDSDKEKQSATVQVGLGHSGQGDHCNEQVAFNMQKRLRKNQCSTVAGFKEVVSQNCNDTIMNHTRNGLSGRVGHMHGYGRYVVKPRLRYQSSEMVSDNTRMNYFSDTDSTRPLIVEWNERENKAVYIADDNESDLSCSIGSDSTYSDGFDEVTLNSRHYAQTKTDDLLGLDAKEDNVSVDREGQEVMDVDQNDDDEDETDDEYYKDVEMVTRDNDVEVDDDGRTSSLSSEKTV
ncbi:hypothetical protein Cni_G09536 [Canna indica]|uniref:Homeobox domain-containing protein n=1 Tax=Canna indica TaxID=4628 RepID=A0AAQ3Q9E2_9LILI|nr:hypothetical protein Cni_G09536 [Canna indica]